MATETQYFQSFSGENLISCSALYGLVNELVQYGDSNSICVENPNNDGLSTLVSYCVLCGGVNNHHYSMCLYIKAKELLE